MEGIELDGSKSFDGDGTIKSYLWTQIAGHNVTLTGDNSAIAKFTAPSVKANSTLTFKLTVTDNDKYIACLQHYYTEKCHLCG